MYVDIVCFTITSIRLLSVSFVWHECAFNVDIINSNKCLLFIFVLVAWLAAEYNVYKTYARLYSQPIPAYYPYFLLYVIQRSHWFKWEFDVPLRLFVWYFHYNIYDRAGVDLSACVSRNIVRVLATVQRQIMAKSLLRWPSIDEHHDAHRKMYHMSVYAYIRPTYHVRINDGKPVMCVDICVITARMSMLLV